MIEKNIVDTLEEIKSHLKLNNFLFVIISGLLIFAFCWPYFKWLLVSWADNPQNTFGYLAPFIFLWAFIRKGREMLSIKPSCDAGGWYFIISGILLLILFQWNRQAAIAALGMPVLIYGLSLIFWGRERSRYLVFPVFFLVFLYPWGDILDFLIGYDLRRLNVLMSHCFFKIISNDAAVSGTYLYTGRFLVDIAPACSGLNILNVLLFLGVIGVYVYRGSIKSKIIIFTSIIPVAITANTIRIICIGLIGHLGGEDLAIRFYESLSGILVFGIAMLLLYFEGSLLMIRDKKLKA